ncbi:hypothetical protein [Pyxidicoccus trucidator]|uniref:hypothetical protein n=1 Tax=Pyxidicoccus trucidator TaxID=2709662 RepID=UPI0013DD023C|nr:hypothetical protein [Pyxidicoccus trucidator]
MSTPVGIDVRGARLIRQFDQNADGVEDKTYAYVDAQGRTQVATDFSRRDASGQVQPPDGFLTQEDAFEQQRTTQVLLPPSLTPGALAYRGAYTPLPGGLPAVANLYPDALEQLAGVAFTSSSSGMQSVFAPLPPSVQSGVNGTPYAVLPNRDAVIASPLLPQGNPEQDLLFYQSPGGQMYLLGTRKEVRDYVLSVMEKGADPLAGARQWGARTEALFGARDTLPLPTFLGLATYQTADLLTLGGVDSARTSGMEWAQCNAEANAGQRPEGCGLETVFAGVNGTALATSVIPNPLSRATALADKAVLRATSAAEFAGTREGMAVLRRLGIGALDDETFQALRLIADKATPWNALQANPTAVRLLGDNMVTEQTVDIFRDTVLRGLSPEDAFVQGVITPEQYTQWVGRQGSITTSGTVVYSVGALTEGEERLVRGFWERFARKSEMPTRLRETIVTPRPVPDELVPILGSSDYALALDFMPGGRVDAPGTEALARQGVFDAMNAFVGFSQMLKLKPAGLADDVLVYSNETNKTMALFAQKLGFEMAQLPGTDKYVVFTSMSKLGEILDGDLLELAIKVIERGQR